MIKLGLTGNIACGKSTVVAMLERLGAAVVDADKLVHGILAAPGPIVDQIAARFGREVLTASGAVDRRALGAVVFRDPGALAELETLLHPEVIRQTWALAAAATAPVFVVDAIKLIESGIAADCDEVWVVACPREQQVARLMTTRGMTRAEANVRIDAQPPASEKITRADVVIDNGGSLADTERQVRAAWNRLLRSRPT